MTSTPSSSIQDLIDHVRRCKRGKDAGFSYQGKPVILCPTWTEVDELEGQGVMPMHVDEAELLHQSQMLTTKDKQTIMALRASIRGSRFLRVIENKRQANG